MPDWLIFPLILAGMVGLSVIGAAVIMLGKLAARKGGDPYRKPHGDVPRVPEYRP